jgi:ubiquinone/menaquinone biosynthesis C-methylase UbiE
MTARSENRRDVASDAGAAVDAKPDTADNAGEAVDVKSRIAAYWASKPQSYAEQHGGTTFRDGERTVTVERGSREYFEYADRTFFAWTVSLHEPAHPFGRIFPYARYAGRDVLEVGCGQGGMAQLWAERGANLTAVDLNDDAVRQTRRRFELFGVTGRIQQEDANRLSFADNSFDYAYSWGVLHHSPSLARSVAELMRVLRPGGEFGVMLYNRRSLLYGYQILYYEGVVHAERRFLSPLALASRYTDGDREEGNPHTWPVTAREARALFAPHAAPLKVRVFGADLDGVLGLVMPGVVNRLPRVVVKAWARRWGWSLWISGVRR